MATWTTLPDSALEPGKPIRSIDALALRDNPVAIIEGESGAPKIWGNAAKRLNTFPVLTVSASNAYRAENGSAYVLISPTTTNSANPPTVVAFRYTIVLYTGSLRFVCFHRSTTNISYLSIYKNNVLVQAYSAGTVDTQRINDVSVVPGDVIEWRHSQSGFGGESIASGATVYASDAYIDTPFYIRASTL